MCPGNRESVKTSEVVRNCSTDIRTVNLHNALNMSFKVLVFSKAGALNFGKTK